MSFWQGIFYTFDLYVSEFKMGAPGYIYDKKKDKMYSAVVGYLEEDPFFDDEIGVHLEDTGCDYSGLLHFGSDYYVGLNIVKELKRKKNLDISGFCIWD